MTALDIDLRYRRPDGSFVIEHRGLPYHVIDGDEPLWSQAVACAADLGAALELEPAFPEPPVTINTFRRAIQAHLDATASERGYDSIHTAVGYRNDPNPVYAAEAQALFVWRSAVWTYVFAELEKVEGGTRLQPSVAEIVAELPVMAWPQS